MFKKLILVNLAGKTVREKEATVNLSPNVIAYIDAYQESSFSGVRIKYNGGTELLVKIDYEDLSKDLIASENKPVIVRNSRAKTKRSSPKRVGSSPSGEK